MVIMGILVTAGFYMSRQELRIGVASKHANMAVNIAQAGANEVMANWNGFQLGNIGVWQDTTIVDTIASGIWTVNIQNANNFVYFLTSTGEVTEGGALWAGASRTIGVTTKIVFANIDPPAALTTRGKTNTEFVPSSPFNIALDSFTLFNAVARMDVTERVQVGVFIKNLTDELALYDGVGTFQDPEAVVAAQPRTIGVNARVTF
jgi:outer membrane receptor protein involved in Fe transport